METTPSIVTSKRAFATKLALAAASATLCAAWFAEAATLHVPADYATIQAAVDAAAPAGDEILIAPGVYHEQVAIQGKQLTLTGTNGTVLSAWTGMALQQPGPRYSYYLIAATTNADVVVRDIDFEGNSLEQSLVIGHVFEALIFWGASGRIQNCTIRGFRGVTQLSSSDGYALSCINPVSTGVGTVNLQVLHNTFADNGRGAAFAGDDGPPPGNPSLLRTTFTLEANAITGSGPTNIDNQWGLQIAGGAAGLIKANSFAGFYDTDPAANLSIAVLAEWSTTAAALQPLRIEANSFLGNQVALAGVIGNNMQFINNYFEGAPDGSGYGLYLTGTNILAAINQFTNLDQGIVLADSNDSNLPSGAGSTVSPTLLANAFCNLNTPVLVEPLVTGEMEVGSQYCPFLPPDFGNLTCSPASGLPGANVTLSGTNLSGATTVLFNGLSASFTPGPDPDQLITAIVPGHATTGPVTVLTPQGNITRLASFTVPVPLTIQPTGSNQVQLSWTADASDFLLEATRSLGTPNWQELPCSPAVGTDQVIWTTPLNAPARFFRLRQP